MSSAAVLISQSNYLGFGFATLHYNALKTAVSLRFGVIDVIM